MINPEPIQHEDVNCRGLCCPLSGHHLPSLNRRGAYNPDTLLHRASERIVQRLAYPVPITQYHYLLIDRQSLRSHLRPHRRRRSMVQCTRGNEMAIRPELLRSHTTIQQRTAATRRRRV